MGVAWERGTRTPPPAPPRPWELVAAALAGLALGALAGVITLL